jgi:hypothetical protein
MRWRYSKSVHLPPLKKAGQMEILFRYDDREAKINAALLRRLREQLCVISTRSLLIRQAGGSNSAAKSSWENGGLDCYLPPALRLVDVPVAEKTSTAERLRNRLLPTAVPEEKVRVKEMTTRTSKSVHGPASATSCCVCIFMYPVE